MSTKVQVVLQGHIDRVADGTREVTGVAVRLKAGG